MFKRKHNENIEDIDEEIKLWKSKNWEKVEIYLFPGEYEYLTQERNFHMIPSLYELKDKKVLTSKNCPRFIKNKKYFRLKKKEKDCLDMLGIEYKLISALLYL